MEYRAIPMLITQQVCSSPWHSCHTMLCCLVLLVTGCYPSGRSPHRELFLVVMLPLDCLLPITNVYPRRRGCGEMGVWVVPKDAHICCLPAEPCNPLRSPNAQGGASAGAARGGGGKSCCAQNSLERAVFDGGGGRVDRACAGECGLRSVLLLLKGVAPP